MEGRGAETTGGGRPRRGVDLVFWLLALSLLIGMAAAIAWTLSNVSLKLREVAYQDDAVDIDLLIPVAPAPPDLAPREPPPTAHGPETGGVVMPRWARPPAPLFPALAASRGIAQGHVSLRCEALASGELGACEIVSESPPGAGFGEAALASMREARVQPRSVDGFRTDAVIRFTVHFRVATDS